MPASERRNAERWAASKCKGVDLPGDQSSPVRDSSRSRPHRSVTEDGATRFAHLSQGDRIGPVDLVKQAGVACIATRAPEGVVCERVLLETREAFRRTNPR